MNQWLVVKRSQRLSTSVKKVDSPNSSRTDQRPSGDLPVGHNIVPIPGGDQQRKWACAPGAWQFVMSEDCDPAAGRPT